MVLGPEKKEFHKQKVRDALDRIKHAIDEENFHEANHYQNVVGRHIDQILKMEETEQ